jgi:ubiquinone/menaquinone biosynthesis C-methylase UbiE/predicted Ser/Thr protein kinase
MNDPVQRCAECGSELPPNVPPGLCPRCALSGVLRLTEADVLDDPPSERSALPRSFGDYELLEEIARGGMGIVYRARQKSLNRIVAVKMILSGQFAGKDEVLRFRAEAESAARLQHPHIVRIHETGEREGQPYFSMDFVEGGNLAALVREKPLSAKRAAAYVKTVAEAIHYAHEQGILHRDLKPSNVLIDQADQPRVTDFGLARRMTRDSFLTLTGEVMGSPNFMPPEQAGAKFKAGRYSDVYGLGAVLFYLVTRRPPFVAGTVAETLQHVLNSEPVSPRLLHLGVPEDIATICLKCLEKEPSRRYPTARLLADELERFLRDEPVLASAAAWTDFNQTLWDNPEYRGRYLEHADEVIPARQYLFFICRSFLNFFAPPGAIDLCDLGCGDGALAEHLLAWRAEARLTLVDGSTAMLESAVRRLGKPENIRFVHATFDRLIRGELRPGPFDVVVSSLAMHHLTTAERVALFFRVNEMLRPGGWFLNLDVALSDEVMFIDWQFELWREWLVETDRLRPASGSLAGVPNEARNNPDNKYGSLSSQLNALRTAGFSDVDCVYRNSIFAIYCGRKPAAA